MASGTSNAVHERQHPRTIGAGAIQAPNAEASAAMERNARASPLLRLPAELCNKVYAYVLHEGVYRFTKVVDEANVLLPPKDTTTKLNPTVENRLSLLSTCRQIYAKTALLPFSLNTFAIRPRFAQPFFKRWLNAAQRGAITSLCLVMSFVGDDWTPFQTSLLLDNVVEEKSLAFRNKLKSLQKITVTIYEIFKPQNERLYESAIDMRPRMETLRGWLEKGNREDVEIIYEEVE